jgi:ribosomal protein S18 acetylase RimI-like enzyme
MLDYHVRPWQSDEDTSAIYALAALLPDEAIASAALPYQLSSWALDDPNNLMLWTTPDGALMAFALFQVPFATLCYGIHPDAEQATLEDAILVWSKERATTLAMETGKQITYHIWPAESYIDTHARLAVQGFARQEGYKFFFAQPLNGSIPAPMLPAGFTARPLAGFGEVEAATQLLCEAFVIDTVTIPWRRRILEQPSYRPELDIVIESPDGRLAAFCLLWLHPHGHTGQIEPMATHPDFQRLGLGSAAIYAGLAQVAALGASRAVVGTSGSNFRSQGMYQATGFRLHHKRIGYQFTAI